MPLLPDEPDVPLVPEEPLLPDVPELPLLPEVPLEPLLPDVPEEPELPLVPDVPEEPVCPDIGEPFTNKLPEILTSVKLICNGEFVPLPACTVCNVFVNPFVLSVIFNNP